jgi:hypothetical protein
VEGVKGSYVIGPPKTKSSFRSVTLPQGVVAALHTHRVRQAAEVLAAGPEYERNDLAFANSVGRPMDLTKVGDSVAVEAVIFARSRTPGLRSPSRPARALHLHSHRRRLS